VLPPDAPAEDEDAPVEDAEPPPEDAEEEAAESSDFPAEFPLPWQAVSERPAARARAARPSF
jgi:hypothetical protein